jgi:hypothetical protein
MTDFSNIEYLKSGNQKQQEAFEILTQNKILSKLAEFDPIFIGTIPINIDIENSDLDIICHWKNKTRFYRKTKFNLLLAMKENSPFGEAIITIIRNLLLPILKWMILKSKSSGKTHRRKIRTGTGT